MIKSLFLLSLLLMSTAIIANVTEVLNQVPTEQEVGALSTTMLSRAETVKADALDARKIAAQKSKDGEKQAKALRSIGLAQYHKMQAINSQQPIASHSGLMVFVSLSMPDQTLRLINKQAAQLNIPVFIRGFYQNDLKATIGRIAEIMEIDLTATKAPKVQPMGGFSIDPVRFEAFKISQVPAFVLIDPTLAFNIDQGISDDDFDVLVGNISVMDAIDIFKKKASNHLKPIAESMAVKSNA